jgi:asparagine synthase (glutamine-hydrolysing)
MCGIAGIILKRKTNFNLADKIVLMADAIKHRGPDGEGFLLATSEKVTPYFNTLKQAYHRKDLKYIPQLPIHQANSNTFLAFAHRRLSILDLSESGHQPMCDNNEKLWISFNGEIYNYIELRSELKNLGHHFYSESDTEVILAAYQEWSFACVERFNGMWAFCIYDKEKQLCFASRDRLGVKPFYYCHQSDFFSFASEQKAFAKAGLIKTEINQTALHNYLINGTLENNASNFFEGVTELWPGTNLVYDIQQQDVSTHVYYHLKKQLNLKNNGLTEQELIEKISNTFTNSIKLRLRSDVEVGTCLSGGIDSSAIAVTIAELTQKPFYCFTSIFKEQPFNEEYFADSVAKKINAKQVKVEPTLNGFLEEVDMLVYSQDVPIWDTSTYAQYKVMELAKQNNIKVVLDGQGADELFGGYHHHFVTLWNSLLLKGYFVQGITEIVGARKTLPHPFIFYLKEILKQQYTFHKKHVDLLFKDEFVQQEEMVNPYTYFNDLNDHLINDIYETRLKSFLKCEDRCGMWHGVESRTPFSDDVELINLLFSFNGNKKIKHGVSKHLLREAIKQKIPKEIYTRYDKKGFETPMQAWMQKMRPMLLDEIKNSKFDFVNYSQLEKTQASNVFHNKLLFKLFVLGRWNKVFGS